MKITSIGEKMKTLKKLVVIVTVILGIVSTSFAEEEIMQRITNDDAADILVQSNNQFALEFYNEVISKSDDGNIFFSPYSISSALGMTYLGAREETASEMAAVLHFNLPLEMLGKAFQSITEELNSSNMSDMETGDPFNLAISNNLWVEDSFNLLFTYKTAVSLFFNASVESLNFIGDPESSRETINNWVAENTMQKILNLIPEGMINAETRLVLTNAVYFKASWQHPFRESATARADFHLSDESVIQVPMMSQTEHFNYASDSDWQAISLNYAGSNSAMLIVLPENISEFEENFDLSTLQNINLSLNSENIRLSMPKFEFSQSMSLNDILQSMGMEAAFYTNADFSGITGQQDLYISDVVHKAFVKVDEEGTEAAAATAVVMNLLSMPEEPVIVDINKPFLFFIQDNETGSVIFMGKVMNPML